MILLDTSVISEFRKIPSGKADENVVNWARCCRGEDLYLSAITVMELELGILRKERKDPVQGRLLRHWLTAYVLPEFRDRVLPVDTQIAVQCARLQVPDPKEEHDAYIAATAIYHNMVVATRNTMHFEVMGVPYINPWLYAP